MREDDFSDPLTGRPTFKVTGLGRANVQAAWAWIPGRSLFGSPSGAPKTTIRFVGTPSEVLVDIETAYENILKAGHKRRGGDYQLLHAVRRRVEALRAKPLPGYSTTPSSSAGGQ